MSDFSCEKPGFFEKPGFRLLLTPPGDRAYHSAAFLHPGYVMTERKWLLMILAFGLQLRLGAALGVQHRLDRSADQEFLIVGDAQGYWHLAGQIASGGEYSVHYPPRYVLRMPGFPALLAVPIALFGKDVLAARILLAIVGTFACWLVYRLARVLFDERAGLIAAALVAVCPTMVLFSVLILSETLFAVGLVGSLIPMALLLRNEFFPDSNRRLVQGSLAVGLLIALACYARPSWLLAAPAFAGLAMLLSTHRKRAAVSGLLVMTMLALSLLPWGLRNRRVTGHFVPTTLWVGASLYDGLSPDATGASDMAFFDRDNFLATMDEYEVDRHYRRAAFRYAADNPGRTAELALLKTVRFWKPWPNAAQFRQWWQKLAVACYFVPLCGFAIVGLVRKRQCVWVLLLTIGPILYFSAVHAVFVGSLRYRLPAEYPLCVMSAVGLRNCWQRWGSS